MVAVIFLIASVTYIGLFGVLVHPKASPTSATAQTVQADLTVYDESGYIDASTLWATEEYWSATGLNPASSAVDPSTYYVFEFFMNIHMGALPGTVGGPPRPDWYNITTLEVVSSLEGKNVTAFYAPSIVQPLSLDMHHSVWTFEFPQVQQNGNATIPENAIEASITIAGLEGCGISNCTFPYTLPLNMSPQSSSGIFGSNPLAGTAFAGLIAAFPLLGGVLVYMSPCFMELTTVYVAMISGLKVSEVVDGKNNKNYRMRVVGSTLLFVAGIAVVYAGGGALVGFTGSLLQADPTFQKLVLPMQLLGGGTFIYLGVMTSGVLPRIGWFKNAPFMPKVNQSCRTGGSFIVGITFGGIQCFRGALVMAMLFLAFTLASPILGALVMFVLAMAFGIPFIAIGVLASHKNLLGRLTPSSSKVFRIGVSLFLVSLGVLTIVAFAGMNPFLNIVYIPAYNVVHALLPGVHLPPPEPIVPP